MYSIHPYSEKYRRAVKAIGSSTFHADVKSQFATSQHTMAKTSLVLKVDSEVIGFALLTFRAAQRGLPKGMEIAFLGIREDYQGKGLGSALLKHILSLNVQHIWLNVAYSNPDAQRLYERNGFRLWRRIGNRTEGGITMGYTKKA